MTDKYDLFKAGRAEELRQANEENARDELLRAEQAKDKAEAEQLGREAELSQKEADRQAQESQNYKGMSDNTR